MIPVCFKYALLVIKTYYITYIFVGILLILSNIILDFLWVLLVFSKTQNLVLQGKKTPIKNFISKFRLMLFAYKHYYEIV